MEAREQQTAVQAGNDEGKKFLQNARSLVVGATTAKAEKYGPSSWAQKSRRWGQKQWVAELADLTLPVPSQVSLLCCFELEEAPTATEDAKIPIYMAWPMHWSIHRLCAQNNPRALDGGGAVSLLSFLKWCLLLVTKKLFSHFVTKATAMGSCLRTCWITLNWLTVAKTLLYIYSDWLLIQA